jgi:hypothetical protein
MIGLSKRYMLKIIKKKENTGINGTIIMNYIEYVGKIFNGGNIFT